MITKIYSWGVSKFLIFVLNVAFRKKCNMFIKNIPKYACCTIDITIACRIIALIGIAISVLLITVLLNDKYFYTKSNYDVSRKTALALGLDWQHFHPQASTSYQHDPEGRMISIIVIFYSAIFLLINLILFFATITQNWRCTVPWLTCELLGCLSKFGALIFHWYCDPQNLTTTFIVGSIAYIVIMVWWWIVVFSAQSSWRHKDESTLTLELSTISSSKRGRHKDPEGGLSGIGNFVRESDKLDSPLPYCPNSMYSLI